jgi:hypothetical protein
MRFGQALTKLGRFGTAWKGIACNLQVTHACGLGYFAGGTVILAWAVSPNQDNWKPSLRARPEGLGK